MNSQIEFAGFQMFCWLYIARSPVATDRKRRQARKNSLRLVRKHPEAAYGIFWICKVWKA